MLSIFYRSPFDLCLYSTGIPFEGGIRALSWKVCCPVFVGCWGLFVFLKDSFRCHENVPETWTWTNNIQSIALVLKKKFRTSSRFHDHIVWKHLKYVFPSFFMPFLKFSLAYLELFNIFRILIEVWNKVYWWETADWDGDDGITGSSIRFQNDFWQSFGERRDWRFIFFAHLTLAEIGDQCSWPCLF